MTQGGVLEVAGLAVVYQSPRGAQRAVDNCDLSVGAGEFVSIIGPSGCGKSTLLGVVAGLREATRGRVSILGSEVRGPRPEVGMVFQRPTLLPWMNVIENVLIPVRALGRSVDAHREQAQGLLKLVGLDKYALHYPHELSGGMQQRVGLARALIHDPGLLLMDEPFAALDAMTRERMSLELQDIWLARRKTVLFITHSIPEAVFLSDRIAVMTPSPGRIEREIAVDLPRQRRIETLASPAFAALCGEIRATFNALAGENA